MILKGKTAHKEKICGDFGLFIPSLSQKSCKKLRPLNGIKWDTDSEPKSIRKLSAFDRKGNIFQRIMYAFQSQ